MVHTCPILGYARWDVLPLRQEPMRFDTLACL
jgi:hypothetical protein